SLSDRSLKWNKEILASWGLFTGLGWIAALKYGLTFEGLTRASEASYNSLVWSHPMFFWGLPFTMGLGLLASMVHVDRRANGPRKVIQIAILSTFAFLLHVVEALLFAICSSLTSLLGRRRETPVGILTSGILLSLLYSALGGYGSLIPRTSILLILIPMLTLVAVSLLGRWGLPRVKIELSGKTLSELLMAIWAAGLVVWILHMDDLNLSSIYQLGQVPWFLYPILLGVLAPLAILSLREGVDSHFLIFVVVSILMGRAITLYKLQGGQVLYWEHRFIFYTALGLAVLSSPLLRRISRDKKLGGLLLAAIVMAGYSSTVLSVQEWHQMNVRSLGTLNDVDFQFALDNPINGRSRALVLTSYTSSLAYLLLPRSYARSPDPWMPEGPETTLLSLYSLFKGGEVSAISTLADLAYLGSRNSSLSYLMMFMGPIVRFPSITTLEVSDPPVPTSKLAIVLPSDTYMMRRALAAYELIREELPIHTTYRSDDPGAPAGLYVGPSSSTVYLNETLPTSLHDLRWLFVIGNFSEGTDGLSSGGGRNLAVTAYELDEGRYDLRACGSGGYVGLIYGYKGTGDYRILQVYSEGYAIHRVVSNGEVRSSQPVRLARRGRCLNISLTLDNGLKAVVNGQIINLPRVDKLGLLGLETGDFKGNLSGRVVGIHRLDWDPPKGSQVLRVDSGPMADWVNIALEDMRKAKERFPGLNLTLKGDGKPPKIVASAFHLSASGSILIRGRPVEVISGDLEVKQDVVRAKRAVLRRGEGFYAVFELEGVEGAKGRVEIRFRLPIEMEINGKVDLNGYHRFGSIVSDLSDVSFKEANLEIVAADKVILLSKIEVPIKSTTSAVRGFNELKYLPESAAVALISFVIIRYLDSKYFDRYAPTRRPKRRRTS
ncbi:MAG: hypothetical protein QI197_08340, partial [Candidatus Korarchaeota archaeon]|nr:hypothetical protein [Candidatus Korarchaeota archaeon]